MIRCALMSVHRPQIFQFIFCAIGENIQFDTQLYLLLRVLYTHDAHFRAIKHVTLFSGNFLVDRNRSRFYGSKEHLGSKFERISKTYDKIAKKTTQKPN